MLNTKSCIRIAIVVLSILKSAICFAQSPDVYRRTVVDEQARPLDYFNVIVKNLPDSTYLKGDTFTAGKLEMRHDFAGRKLVEIQSLGYEDVEYVEDFSAPTSPDTLVMKLSVTKLDAVVVKSRVPQVSTERGKSVISVAGSSLQNLPEVTDILRRAPGIKADDSEISVFGKGTPQIFIDGREATYAELKLLQPQQILTIEVDRNPSARYDASFSSVIKVRTNRAQHQTSGQIANNANQGRRYRNSTSAQLQIASKRWVNYFSYQYADQLFHNYVYDNQTIHTPYSPASNMSPVPPTSNVVNSDRLDRIRRHSVLYGSTFEINPRHQLSWQYSGTFGNDDIDNHQQERIDEGGATKNITALSNLNWNHESHSANARYRFQTDSVSSLEITADWARSSPWSRESIMRHNVESGEDNRVTVNNRSRSDVSSIKAEYSTPLLGAELLAGLRYGHIDSRTTSVYNEKTTVTDLLNNNIAVYATLEEKYTKWGWSAGLRGEFLNDNIQVGGKTLRNGWEKNLFPSMSLYTKGLTKTIDLSLSYTCRITRPSVSEMNPAISYVNSMLSSSGNPLLRSTIRHSIELGTNLWSKLNITLSANLNLNPIFRTGEIDDTSGAILFRPVNIARSQTYMVDATYNNNFGPLSLTLNGGVEFPHTNIPYQGTTISIGKPSWYSSIDADVKLAKNTSLTAGFDYQGRNYYLMTIFEPSNNLTFGITQYLLNRRLQLSVSANDLLRRSMPAWRDIYDISEISQSSSYDTRRVRISVRWMFNNHKNKYREQGRSEEFNRIN